MKQFCIVCLSLLLGLPVYAIDMAKLQYGGQIRIRGYELKNIWNFDNENKSDVMRMFRIKASLHVMADLGDGISGMIKMTNQTYGEGISDDLDNKSNKVFSENAYIDIKRFSGLPFNLRIGRQNLMYGSGFVLFDGQPQYGSTSAYFDAIKTTLILNNDAFLDVIYAKDQENNREETHHDDITLSGVYLTLPKTLPFRSESYLLNRLDEGKDKVIYMLGLRVLDKLEMGLDYSAEGAFQKGKTDLWVVGDTDSPTASRVDHKAFATKIDVGFTFDVRLQPRLFTQYAYFTGDDPDTEEYEGWDVFYGGSVQFGDLLAWQFLAVPSGNVVSESAMASTLGEVTYMNFTIGTVGVNLLPADKFCCTISASMIKWNEDFMNYTGGWIEDDDFGNYYQFELKYGYSKNLNFRLYAAMIDPGDAFKDTAKDNASEIFYEVDLRF